MVILNKTGTSAEALSPFGFYIPQAVGNHRFPHMLRRNYMSIPRRKVGRIASSDRHATPHLPRIVPDASRTDEAALYIPNGQDILLDLPSPCRFRTRAAHVLRGLPEKWAVRSPAAVVRRAQVRQTARSGSPLPPKQLIRAVQLTDPKGEVFDVAGRFTGSIARVNDLLTSVDLLNDDWHFAERGLLPATHFEKSDGMMARYPDNACSATFLTPPRVGEPPTR